MQVDNFTFQDHVVLPASLRYVAIYNEAFELLRPIGALLKVCRWGPCASRHRRHASAGHQPHDAALLHESCTGARSCRRRIVYAG